MTASKWAAIAGFIAAITLVAGLITAAGDLETSDSDEEIIEAIEDSKGMQVAGVYFGAVAAISLVAFVSAGLKPRLKAASRNDGDRGLAAVVQPAFGLAAAAIAVGHVALGAVAASVQFDDAPVDPGAVRALWHLGFGAALVVGGLALALAVGATSIHALRSGSLPKWLAWVGLFTTLCMLGAVIFVPMIMMPIWLIAASIVLWRGAPATA